MKILMLTPDNQMIDRRILLEAVSLVDAGHDVTLLAGFECAKEEKYEYHGVKVHRLCYDWNDTRLIRLQKYFPQNQRARNLLNKVYLKIAHKYFTLPPFEHFVFRKAQAYPADVIHVHDFPALRVGAVIAQKRGVPLVYDAHEIYYAQEVLPRKKRREIRRNEKKWIRHASAVITVNEFIARIMARRHGIAEPHVLYNATKLPAQKLAPAASPLRKKFPDDAVVLLYQGWISGERNLETMIRAMPLLPPKVCLAIIGYGAYETALREMVETLGLQGRVVFFGRIENEQILEYTFGADLGLIPYLPIDENHLYCSPNKFFEYIAAGVPILGHQNPFFKRMKQNYGMVEVADLRTPESTARGILPLIENRSRLQELRARCEDAAKVLNWDVEAGKLLDIYRRLGAEAPREKAGV